MESDVFEDAIDKWGVESQIVMAQEECAELITELARDYRGRSDDDALAEEIADVQIMMEQLELVVGRERVREAREGKLERLRERLDGA